MNVLKACVRTLRRARKWGRGTVANDKENQLRALLDDLDREFGRPDARAEQWASSVLKSVG